MNEHLGPEFPCEESLSPKFLCPDELGLWPAVMEDSRQPALQKHVESCLSCQQRVAAIRCDVQAIQNVDWTKTPRASQLRPREELPETIGEYTILARLGSGGQADVYRAWHPRLKTDVVIKWFRADSIPEGASPAFTTEARMLSTIRHPYLAQVFDVGVEQGRPFIMMEYVAGYTFSTWMRRFQPTIFRIVSVLAKAARAVDAVHRHGFLHLDLKPANILVDEDGNPRVIDFGMARRPENGSPHSLLLAPGTPEYMSPEQCAGDANRITVATDVYGLGAVLFAALSLQPIRFEDQMTLEPDWSLIRHAPWSLRGICQRALATRPEDRWKSAAELALELEQLAESRVVRSRGLAIASLLAGMVSCCAGAIQAPASHSMANLDIHSHSQRTGDVHSVFETNCAARLGEQRTPCLLVATATTPPVLASVNHLADADVRIAQWADDEAALQIDDRAGPHLILACANREQGQLPSAQLAQLLQAFQSCTSEHSIRILIDHQQVSLLPTDSTPLGGSESQVRATALTLALEMQASLDHCLPTYSGIVVIPAQSPLLASIP